MTSKPHKRLFLTASFADVSVGFDKFLPDCQGKTVAFIPTACDVEEYTKFMDDDRQAFMDLGMVVDELDLSAMDFDTLCQKITKCDCVFVGGGNTFYLLSMLKTQDLINFSYKPSMTASLMLAHRQAVSLPPLTLSMWHRWITNKKPHF